jgi:predicted MPP superfamily phosphohydrolase
MLIYESAALTAIAYLVAIGLRPGLRSGRGGLAFACGALAVYVPWLMVRDFGVSFGVVAPWLAGTWVFACLLIVAVGLPLLLVRGVVRLWLVLARRNQNSNAPRDESRREFIGNVALPAVALSLGGGGALGGVSNFVLRKVELRIHNWPKALDGFRIGQITDTHVGDFVTPDTVRRAVELLNESNVHLQVMTGDLVDNLKYLEPTFDALERCRAPYGMLTVLGNHEKMHQRLEPMLAAYARRRSRGTVRLLVDTYEIIRHNGARFQVVGVDYPMYVNGNHLLRRPQRLALMEQSAQVAFSQVGESSNPVVCLSHHPEFFPLAAERNVSLTLSGHTHGGQIAVAGKSIFSTYQYMLGHYQLGSSHLYVSGGTGHWLPVRFGVPTEVTVITLRSA